MFKKMKNKILSLDKLNNLLKAKSKNKKIVLCHGVLNLPYRSYQTFYWG